MAGRTAWVLADQLSPDNPALEGADRLLMIEARKRPGKVAFHRQKLHLVWSAMRHFAAEHQGRGIEVDYRFAESLSIGLREHLEEFEPESVALLEPNTLGAGERLSSLDQRVEVIDGCLFLTHPAEFAEWAEGRKQLRMENFYRDQRRRYGLLMDGDDPAGGEWNFDPENRKPPPADERAPKPYRPREDEIDAAVRKDLDQLTDEIETVGSDGKRIFPATRAEAKRALASFCEKRLPWFGPYQDAMVEGERFMWHALISSSLNLGLLEPLECAEAAEREYRAGNAPIASVEGFIRQVIGWREYVWGMYRLRGAEMRGENALNADGDLPAAVAELDPSGTEMACLADVLAGIDQTAYGHHIERLMVLGNLMLTVGVEPQTATDWFHGSFIDGYEWVMAPNVIGMALWADGGKMMSKPYAATGAYVNRMSTYCPSCRYDPKKRAGDDACPLTTLYWDFLDRNREILAANPRMTLQVRNLDRIEAEEMDAIRDQAKRLRKSFSA
jgi:deoxyribodipyrimidine photolyase-related protein